MQLLVRWYNYHTITILTEAIVYGCLCLEIKPLILCTCLILLSILWDGRSDFDILDCKVLSFFRYLSYNKIRQIKKKHFQNCPLTSRLYLASNEIGWIEDGTLNHVVSSGTLYEVKYISIIYFHTFELFIWAINVSICFIK